MADGSIKKDFIDGTYEIFTTMFNNGSTNGIKLYLLSDEVETNIYGECKFKKYKKPITLVSYVSLEPLQNEHDVEVLKYISYFEVPLKTLQQNELSVTKEGLEILKKAMIEFQGTFYSIDEITPRVYIDDIFLFYSFKCIEEKNIESLSIEEEPKDPEEEQPEVEEQPEESGGSDG